jgi:hypothetical protein
LKDKKIRPVEQRTPANIANGKRIESEPKPDQKRTALDNQRSKADQKRIESGSEPARSRNDSEPKLKNTRKSVIVSVFRFNASNRLLVMLKNRKNRAASAAIPRGILRHATSGYSALLSGTFSEDEIGGTPALPLVRGGQVDIVENGAQVVLKKNQA